MSRSRELTKNTLIITIGRISTQFVSFLLLPLYTTLLSTSEYGTVDLITTLVQLLIPIMSVMIDQGVFRFLLNCSTSHEKRETISSAIFLLIITSVSSIVAYLIINAFVEQPYMIWLLLILIATAFNNLFLQIARGLKHTPDYALGSFICSSSTIVLNVLCIAFLQMGATGMLVATFIGNIICCIFLFFKLRIGLYVSLLSVKKTLLIDELKYSIPLVPNQLSVWVLNSSDRILVTLILGASANGILAISHKFPTVYMTLFSVFLLAWHETGAVHFFDEDRDDFFTDMINKIMSIFSVICMAIIVALPIVFNLFINSAYNEAYNNIPIYLVAALFNVLIGLLGVVYVATKKTGEIAKTTLFAAIINIVVNILLIRHIGLYAASISTFIGYLLTMVYRIIDTRKYLQIKYDIKRYVVLGSMLLCSCVIYYLNNKLISIICIPFFILLAYLLNRDVVSAVIIVMEEKTKIKRKMIANFFKVLVLVTIVATIIAAAIFYYSRPKDIQSGMNVQTKHLKQQILFTEIGADDFTCTGLTYNKNTKSYWIADYGALHIDDQTHPRIVEIDRFFSTTKRVIPLDKYIGAESNLQGLTFDSKDNLFWIAIGEKVVSIDYTGRTVNTITSKEIKKYKANGVSYDESDDSIWILCAEKYIMHYSKSGDLIDSIKFNYKAQDHICAHNNKLYITVGDDYTGNNNYLCIVSQEDGHIFTVYRLLQSNSIEGVCINDGTIIVANDGLYHSDVVKHSYLSFYTE